jgi:hypothetical protein
MKKINLILVILSLFNLSEYKPLEAAGYKLGITGGYLNGVGWQLHGVALNFATGFPFSARLSVGNSYLDPGNSAAARGIFINNTTNGIPEKSGNLWHFRFDLNFPLNLKSIPALNLTFGPRYASFKGNFKYVGGNEDFDVTSSQWGLGLGIAAAFSMTRTLDLIMISGLDYYFQFRLKGHDTSYSPNGEDVNPRENYTFSDADNAINQPGFEPYIMFGVAYRF